MLLTCFWNSRHGGVAPMVALAIVPLVGAVRAAVDYTRASAARTALQTSCWRLFPLSAPSALRRLQPRK
jgi:Flp pilus assembly protein TadG